VIPTTERIQLVATYRNNEGVVTIQSPHAAFDESGNDIIEAPLHNDVLKAWRENR